MQAAAGDGVLWVVGGGELASQFAEAGELDDVIVSYMPVVLGTGIGLFARPIPGQLELTSTEELTARRRPAQLRRQDALEVTVDGEAVLRLAERDRPGSRIGFLKRTSAVNASGSRSAARQRAFVHIPWAMARGKPNGLAAPGVQVDRVVVAETAA